MTLSLFKIKTKSKLPGDHDVERKPCAAGVPESLTRTSTSKWRGVEGR